MSVNNGYGEITKDEIIDILHNTVYRQVYQYFKQTGTKYLEVTNDKFQVNGTAILLGESLLNENPELESAYLSSGFCIDRSPLGIVSDNAPMTIKEVSYAVKHEIYHTKNSIRDIVWLTLHDTILNMLYSPKDQAAPWFKKTYVLRNIHPLHSEEVRSKVNQMTKPLFASATGLGFSLKRAQNLLAGRYVNWLGKEHMHKMYGICGPKATAEAYNMYMHDTKAFDYYYNNPRTHNWVIAVMTGMHKNHSIRPPLYNAIIEEQEAYTDRDPEKIKLFSSVSPSLLRTVYDKYPQLVHAIVAAAHQTNQTRLPSYTICRYMCYHPWLINPDTVKYATLLETDKKHRRKSQYLKLNMVLKFHRTYISGKPWPVEDTIIPEIDPLPF